MLKILILTLISTFFCQEIEYIEKYDVQGFTKMKDSCEDLVNDIGFSGKPILVESFMNLTLSLTSEEKKIFDDLILQFDIVLENESYSSIEKVLYLAMKTKEFFVKHPTVLQKYRYTMIGEWGTIDDFIQIGVYYSAEKFDKTLMVNKDEQYDIIEAIKKVQLQSTDKAAFDVYINRLLDILKSTTTDSKKYYQIYSIFLEITYQYPSIQDYFFKTKIGGNLTIFMYNEFLSQYYRIEKIKSLFIGTPRSLFMEALYGCLNNPIYGVLEDEKKHYEELFEKLTTIIGDDSLTYTRKIRNIAYQINLFLEKNPNLKNVLLSFKILDEFGTLGDFFSMFIFGEYQDCWDKNDFDLSSTNELEVTTKSVTGDCSTVVDVVLRDINGVSMFWPTIFVSDEFNSMPKNGIAMYKILCKRFYDNIISQNGITKVKKCAMIKSTCLDFFTTYGYMERVIRALPLDNWGNIGQFLSCNFNE